MCIPEYNGTDRGWCVAQNAMGLVGVVCILKCNRVGGTHPTGMHPLSINFLQMSFYWQFWDMKGLQQIGEKYRT